MENVRPQQLNETAVRRLTALWALSESGLGGIMFALKIPFTGFFLGAIALIILSLLAVFTGNSAARLLRATVIVLIVKAVVSPHSSPPAYIAVAFQGCMAAGIFALIRNHRIACIVVGMLSMLESALQKLLVLTLIFGKHIWNALQALLTDITKPFSRGDHHEYIWTLLTIYLILYACWGALVGWWASGLPQRLEQWRANMISNKNELATIAQEQPKSTLPRLAFYGLLLVVIIGILVYNGAGKKLLITVLLRSIAAILLLFVIVRPLVNYGVQRWLRNRPAGQQQEAREVMALLPQLRVYAGMAYRRAAVEKGIIKKAKTFIMQVLVLSLYGE